MMSNRTTLCLACSACLPPRRIKSFADPSSSSAIIDATLSVKPFGPSSADDTFSTQCCQRPICPSCLASNPRLARYNPCLHCLGGVGVVSARSMPLVLSNPSDATPSVQYAPNIDGGLHDENVFVVGDEDEDDETEPGHGRVPELLGSDHISNESSAASSEPSTPPPPYEQGEHHRMGSPSITVRDNAKEDNNAISIDVHIEDEKSPQHGAPHKYYIKPGDTLLGISLKYGIDGRLLCRMNGLSPSTLRTTPHLLHTRTFLTLPPTARNIPSQPLSAERVEDAEHEARRVRERAEKRFQMLTKEVDWRVAKAYVALAEASSGDDDIDNATPPEGKEGSSEKQEKKIFARDPFTGAESSLNLEARAIDRYLDDDEWEERGRQTGRGVSIPRFPLFEAKGKKMERKSWWKLR